MTQSTQQPKRTTTTLRWWIGMMMASFFTMIYYVVPIYLLTAMLALLFRYPSPTLSWIYAAPIFISAVLPPIALPFLIRSLRPMLDYFDYEEILETSPVNVKQEILNGKNYLCVMQPHGVISYVSIAACIESSPEFQGTMPTAVADAVVHTPILKHVLGIFGIVSASKSSLIRELAKTGPQGCVVLYVGGIAELFLTCNQEEQIYLRKRKGFIKLALQQGVDVVPVYLFGNTTALSTLKIGLLATISRQLQLSLTYVWGKWGLPIPRDCKLLYAGGQPLGMPQIDHPTQVDIDKWHTKYCHEVVRIFDKYKERVPAYKHKKLHIV